MRWLANPLYLLYLTHLSPKNLLNMSEEEDPSEHWLLRLGFFSGSLVEDQNEILNIHWIKLIDDWRCSLLTCRCFTLTAVLLLRLVIRPFLLLFFWVSWFIYCVNVFIWALRMTFLAHVWLLDTKRMYSVELSEDSLSLSLSENALNYGSHGATHNCSMPKNRVQLSSPVTTNERYKHIISCSLRFVFQFLLADCILSVFTKYLSKTCFIISYVQIAKLNLPLNTCFIRKFE